MLELVYLSRAKQPFSEQELLKLLDVSRFNNARSGITGMLLYDGRKTFIQAIEGEEEAIEKLFKKISADSRHGGITILWKSTIGERQFENWEMGFHLFSDDSVKKPEGYSDFMQQSDHSSDELNSFARTLLTQFKNTQQGR